MIIIRLRALGEQELDPEGSRSSRHFVCKSSVVMTDDADLETGKVLGKIQVGDLLEALDEETVEWKACRGLPLPRRRFRWQNQEGWATLQGNAGTKYLEQSQEHYVLRKPLALWSSAGNGSLLRELQPGEVWRGGRQVTEERPPQKLMKVRGSCGDSGWLSFLPTPEPCVTYLEDTE